ncbi:hypothetical protein BC826DRAFT_165885 [Russula brevipes]|nr:hypothetical protein BC826DRAFT_165885 [Russula brevipes]
MFGRPCGRQRRSLTPHYDTAIYVMSLDTADDTGPPATPTLVSPSGENTALAFRIYKEVWDEFNKWKVEDCRQQLRLLQKPLPSPEAAEAATEMAPTFRTGEPGDVEIVYLCDAEDDAPLEASGGTVLTCNAVDLKLPPDFLPHPRYESCAPSPQTIGIRVTSAAFDEFGKAPFVPYADDPTFNANFARGYLRQFPSFAWEELVDPDVEEIQFEVLRRLCVGHGLSLEDIDATNVLPKLRENNQSGFIYGMTQRDRLFWTGSIADLATDADTPEGGWFNPRTNEPGIDDLRRRIQSIAPYFCANPGCIQALCPRHVEELNSDGSPRVLPPAVPRVASGHYPEGSSCGGMCFREIDSASQQDDVVWEDAEVDELRCVLEIIPDTIPCGLAKLVRRPCREVFVHRRRLISDDRIYPESSQALTVQEKEAMASKTPVSMEKSVPLRPCSHIGPCDINNRKCICAEKSVHCTANCYCGPPCRRRRPGCRCTGKGNKKKTCERDSRCPCFKAGWECDPMVCLCETKSTPKRGKPVSEQRRAIKPYGKLVCQNSDIQRGVAAELEIKRGKFGLGAFAVKPIHSDQFIGEYIGELIPISDDKRMKLREHVGLNYNFTLDKENAIDSARVGNETRYINHGEQKDANATGIAKFVFGEARIGFYALRNIKADEEIRFDYGVAYWPRATEEET